MISGGPSNTSSRFFCATVIAIKEKRTGAKRTKILPELVLPIPALKAVVEESLLAIDRHAFEGAVLRPRNKSHAPLFTFERFQEY